MALYHRVPAGDGRNFFIFVLPSAHWHVSGIKPWPASESVGLDGSFLFFPPLITSNNQVLWMVYFFSSHLSSLSRTVPYAVYL